MEGWTDVIQWICKVDLALILKHFCILLFSTQVQCWINVDSATLIQCCFLTDVSTLTSQCCFNIDLLTLFQCWNVVDTSAFWLMCGWLINIVSILICGSHFNNVVEIFLVSSTLRGPLPRYLYAVLLSSGYLQKI